MEDKKLGMELKKTVDNQAVTDKIYAEMNEQIALAEKAGSFMVAISRKEGDKLFHWRGSIRFTQEDVPHCLREHLSNVPNTQKETGKVRRFAPKRD